jgi:manganese transport protein
VEEGVTSQVYGQAASGAEVEAGEQYLERIAQSLRDQGVSVETAIAYSVSPSKEILRYAAQINPDLVIMGAHGHGGLKDLPMLIVRPGKS